ncbi:hypothetical protein CHM34_18300 [Paludifilum halophilum]|uniref:Yip1 domain-containing protein n=1 Tax=Paludifilum halophilum TaxID=1642702 RepID=A0A235B188_9BACL|nr:hypothetical protein CHM34_18300 [Paludifilum halophilum]
MPALLVFSLILGPIFGLVGWAIISGLTYWTGSWLGGTGTWKEIRTASAWAGIPFIATLIVWIPQLLLFGREMFTTAMPSLDQSFLLVLLFLFLNGIDLVLTVWYYVVFSKSLGEAHGFSSWKGFFSIVISYLLLIAPFILLAILFRI